MWWSKSERERREALFAGGLKPCPKCGEELPLSAFSKDSRTPTGLKSWCKLCMKASRKEYRKREECLAHYRQYQRRYRKEHPEVQDWHRRYLREYRKDHREEERNRCRKYRNTPKGREMYRRAEQRRRTQKVGLPATLTDNEWLVALAYFDDRCAYCGASEALLHQEHIVPLSVGGGYIAANIVPACKRCNSSKGTKALEDWATDGGAAFVLPKAIEIVRTYQGSGEKKEKIWATSM